MPCLIRRYHVTNMMVFLVVTMILVNVYALGVFLSNHPAFEPNSALVRKETKDTEIVVDEAATSIRFVVARDGSVRLVAPRELRRSEVHAIVLGIKRKFHELRLGPATQVQGYVRFVNRLKRALNYSPQNGNRDPSFLWARAAEWPFQVDNYKFQNMGEILRLANKAEILEAKNSRKGTQLKVEVLLDGGQVALFKPAWYPHGTVISGNVYGGKDRHFGEIAAFYLNQLLGYYNGPITVGRRVNLAEEVLANADDKLGNTFFRDEGRNLCFYGVCYYCNRNDSVCGQGDHIDGALILLLNKKLRIVANPWRRTYKQGIIADWQSDANFCSTLLKNGSSKKRREVILDIVAVSVFDFLIGNGDRHHFEMYADPDNDSTLSTHSKSILLIDNGKSFGNADEDYIDILAPLYQCCRIRQALLRTLKKFRGVLGKALDSISSFDALYPLLAKRHLEALDRRLAIVLATVEVCIDRYGMETVIV